MVLWMLKSGQLKFLGSSGHEDRDPQQSVAPSASAVATPNQQSVATQTEMEVQIHASQPFERIHN
jgi:hypothetical protein